jgi:hypothetical protein
VAALVLALAADGTRAQGSGYLGADSGSTHVSATQLRALLQSKIPTVPTLIVFNQCYGGNCVPHFSSQNNVAVLSATSPGQLSKVPSYDAGAALGLRANPPPRTAMDTHNDALMRHAASGAVGAGMTPMTGGGMPPANFALLGVDSSTQARVSIIFYAGGTDPADSNDAMNLGTIREFYPNSRYYVLGSGSLSDDQNRFSAAGYAELSAALDAVASPILLGETVILWVGGHGGSIRPATNNNQPPINPTMFHTDPLPQSDGDAILGQEHPEPRIVLEIPAQEAALMLPASGPPLFAQDDWTISVPWSGGTYNSSSFSEARYDGGDGIVGDDPDDVIQLTFIMPATIFVDAFVGRTNVVTVTNNDGQAWPMRLLLDTGPIAVVVAEPCPADFNASGAVTVQDIFEFLAAYFGDDPSADFNASGTISVQDIFEFLSAYFSPCP